MPPWRDDNRVTTHEGKALVATQRDVVPEHRMISAR
jgi:hypothetical protein